MQLRDAIKERKSTKRFSGKSVDLKKLIRMLDNLRSIPCAGNMYNLKYTIVQDSEKIKKIATAAQQDFINEAGAVIAVTGDRDKVKKMYDYNDKGFAAQQAGAAIQTLLLLLTEEKLDSCWVGFYDEGLMSEALGTKGQVIEAVIPIGFATKNKKEKTDEKVRPELGNIVFFEKYGNKKLEPATRVKHDTI